MNKPNSGGKSATNVDVTGILGAIDSDKLLEVLSLHPTVAEVEEAAMWVSGDTDVFGANPWQRFVRITLPLLKPSIQTALILRTVLAFEMFATVLSLGGRNFPVLVSEAFNWQYFQQDYGVAAAYAIIVMIASLASTLVYLRLLRTPAEQLP